MVPLAKFDISLKNAPPGVALFCTESWQRFPPIFFLISLAPTNIVVRVHTKNYGKTQKTKGIYRKTQKVLRRRETPRREVAASSILYEFLEVLYEVPLT